MFPWILAAVLLDAEFARKARSQQAKIQTNLSFVSQSDVHWAKLTLLHVAWMLGL